MLSGGRAVKQAAKKSVTRRKDRLNVNSTTTKKGRLNKTTIIKSEKFLDLRYYSSCNIVNVVHFCFRYCCGVYATRHEIPLLLSWHLACCYNLFLLSFFYNFIKLLLLLLPMFVIVVVMVSSARYRVEMVLMARPTTTCNDYFRSKPE